METELLSVAQLALERLRNYPGHEDFILYADGVIRIAQAIRIGSHIGRREGWDIFEGSDDVWRVEADHDAALLDTDDQAIRLARRAGVQCDDDGVIQRGEKR